MSAMHADVPLCEDCGDKIELMQAAALALGEALPVEVLAAELCGMCLYLITTALD